MDKYNFPIYGLALPDELGDLAQRVSLIRPDNHYLLGIAGPPMSGADELADKLVRFLSEVIARDDEVAIAVHYESFRKPGHQFKPGNGGPGRRIHIPYWSPGSFESDEFCQYVLNIRQFPYETHPTSTYEHTTDRETPDGLIVRPSHKIVIVECPFLLYQAPPWTTLFAPQKVFDRTFYVDVPPNLLDGRFYEFYREMGLNHEEARGLIDNEDLATARMVTHNKEAADVILTPSTTN